LLSAPDLPSLTPGGFSAKWVHAAIAVHAAAAAAAAAAASMAQRISLATVPHRIARMQIRARALLLWQRKRILFLGTACAGNREKEKLLIGRFHLRHRFRVNEPICSLVKRIVETHVATFAFYPDDSQILKLRDIMCPVFQPEPG